MELVSYHIRSSLRVRDHVDHMIAQAVSRQVLTVEGPCLHPGKSMWEL
jgi:hypothetical protein